VPKDNARPPVVCCPQATLGLYISLPLAVTFPFNVGIGIALYTYLATLVLG
jgi:hypothetical protein